MVTVWCQVTMTFDLESYFRISRVQNCWPEFGAIFHGHVSCLRLQCKSKNWGFLTFFPKRLRIFNQNFTCLLHVHTFANRHNFIQLSPTLTNSCCIKHDRPRVFAFHRNFNHLIHFIATHQIHSRPQPTWLPYVGCNASGISQTLLKAKDHPRAKKCTAVDLWWFAAYNDQQSYQRLLQTSERVCFGRWWTFWAYDVNLVQKYFNSAVCCFIRCKQVLFNPLFIVR